MALNLRQKQTSCIIRMMNLNQMPNPGGATTGASSDQVYTILVLNHFCRDILSPLIHAKDLQKHGITLYFVIDKDRQIVINIPSIYFAQPSPDNISRIIADASRGIYVSFHFNLSSSLPHTFFEDLTAGALKEDDFNQISKLYDKYLEFVTLERNLFSLAQCDIYLQLNDP